ncbi:hypothetical protein SH449x_004093 [Pirellulaceae bacterium SH449]
MARIRTIKPEFPQSESMGRISRDARLCFVLMWTIADDSGRLRGNSRMLASLLFPYDDDAPSLIDGWLKELEEEKCIVRYVADDRASYVEIANWREHQKIDKPSVSKLPGPNSSTPREDSRSLENVREASIPSRARADQGPRTKDQGEDQGEGEGSAPAHTPLEGKSKSFQTAWKRWRSHQRENFTPLTPTSEEAALMELGRCFPDNEPEQVKAIEFSILRRAKNLITSGDHNRARASPQDPKSGKAKGEELVAKMFGGAR